MGSFDISKRKRPSNLFFIFNYELTNEFKNPTTTNFDELKRFDLILFEKFLKRRKC